jgi:hypothetical protein
VSKEIIHVKSAVRRYDLMLRCWQLNADDRPGFEEVHRLVSAMVEELAGEEESTL